MIRIGPTEESILNVISESIERKLNCAGIFYRVFSRIKTRNSIEKKISEKSQMYIEKGKKMQDVFGVRVTVYFQDDEHIAASLVKSIFQEKPDGHSIDLIDKERFGPIRHNLVFEIDSKLCQLSSLFDQNFIDSTFEVQFRTIFSEGWHEVEHDLRYKCKGDWKSEDLLFRQLNGQLASLETCDWAMLKIFDELAYKKYKNREWPSFFRNVLRIRFEDLGFSDEVMVYLNKDFSVGRELLKIDREELIMSLANISTAIPLKMDNVLFIINRAILKRENLVDLEPTLLKRILDGLK